MTQQQPSASRCLHMSSRCTVSSAPDVAVGCASAGGQQSAPVRRPRQCPHGRVVLQGGHRLRQGAPVPDCNAVVVAAGRQVIAVR